MQFKRVLLFILNPFVSAVDSIINIKRRGSAKLLYCWFIVFGMCFCAVNKEADSYRYYQDFIRDSNLTYSEFSNRISDFFTFESDTKDIYTLSVNFLVSRFSQNYHWVFLLYAIIFGLFYIKTVKIFAECQIDNKAVFYVLLFLLCFSNPIFNINGVRFWTAAWITVYCFFKIAYYNKPRYLVLLLVTPLIHTIYIITFVFALLYVVSKRMVTLWMVAYIVSAFVSAMSFLNVFEGYLDYLPDAVQRMFHSYAENEARIEYLEGVTEPLYARILKSLPKYYLMILSVILIIKHSVVLEDKSLRGLFVMYFIIASFANFTMGIPSLGIRFIQLTMPLLAVLWVKSYNQLKQFNLLLLIGVPICFAYSLVPWFRNVVSVTEIPLYLYPLPLQIIKYLFLP